MRKAKLRKAARWQSTKCSATSPHALQQNSQQGFPAFFFFWGGEHVVVPICSRAAVEDQEFYGTGLTWVLPRPPPPTPLIFANDEIRGAGSSSSSSALGAHIFGMGKRGWAREREKEKREMTRGGGGDVVGGRN